MKTRKHKILELENFDFIHRHNCLYTEERLTKMGLCENALCKICTKENENLLHMFFNCEKLKCFKQKMFEIVDVFIGKDWQSKTSWEMLLMFGYSGKCKNTYVLNMFLAVA